MNWLQAAVLMPVVLFVPGYAITAAIFPPRAIAPSDRIVYSFVFSISAASIGGLVLQVVLGLDVVAWLGVLSVIALSAAAVARNRRTTAVARERLNRPPSGILWAGSLLIALVIAVAAIVIAKHGVREQQSRQVFASLWAVPNKAEKQPGRPAPLTVGVWNHGAPRSYRLQVSRGGSPIESLPVRLGADHRWQTTLSNVSGSTGSMEITLFHDSHPYRRLRFNIGEGP